MIARAATAWLLITLALAGCQATENAADPEGHAHAETDDHGHDHGEAESWAVTAWGEHFEIFAEAERIRSEYVLAVKGLVRERPEGTINPNMATGRVEVLARELSGLGISGTLT